MLLTGKQVHRKHDYPGKAAAPPSQDTVSNTHRVLQIVSLFPFAVSTGHLRISTQERPGWAVIQVPQPDLISYCPNADGPIQLTQAQATCSTPRKTADIGMASAR